MLACFSYTIEYVVARQELMIRDFVAFNRVARLRQLEYKSSETRAGHQNMFPMTLGWHLRE